MSASRASSTRSPIATASRAPRARPGRTQELIFFSAEDPVTLVDMPGYGYAAAPKAKVAAWTDLIHAYLKGRANLLRVYVLVDARRGLGAADDPVLTSLDEAAVSYQVVLTKCRRGEAAGARGLRSGRARGARQASGRLSRGARDLRGHRRRHPRAARGDRAAGCGAAARSAASTADITAACRPLTSACRCGRSEARR